MEINHQQIFREKTFGSYPQAEEIRRLHSREKFNTKERWGPNLGILTPRSDYAEKSYNIAKLPPLKNKTDYGGFSSARQPKPPKQSHHAKRIKLRRSMSFVWDGLGSSKQQENTKTHFQPAQQLRNKYHFINPEWLSEELSYKRLYREHDSDPFKYGWA